MRIENYQNGALVSVEVIPATWENVRADRAPLLAQADIEINKAQDAGNAARETALRAYRQQLRDITIDFPTPDAVVWPTMPEAN
jgi:hypothetical protein